jgi:hypothetical protein
MSVPAIRALIAEARWRGTWGTIRALKLNKFGTQKYFGRSPAAVRVRPHAKRYVFDWETRAFVRPWPVPLQPHASSNLVRCEIYCVGLQTMNDCDHSSPVAEDDLGNKFFENKTETYGRDRWVEYSDEKNFDSSNISPR